MSKSARSLRPPPPLTPRPKSSSASSRASRATTTMLRLESDSLGIQRAMAKPSSAPATASFTTIRFWLLHSTQPLPTAAALSNCFPSPVPPQRPPSLLRSQPPPATTTPMLNHDYSKTFPHLHSLTAPPPPFPHHPTLHTYHT